MDDGAPILGVDLGTTNSLVAVYEPGVGPRVLEGADGQAIVPSAVRYEPDGSRVVGVDARDRSPEYPLTTVASVKRLMGRSLDDARDDLPFLGYEVVQGEHETARVRLPGGRVLSPQEVSADILGELKKRACEALGRAVSKAVVTVPAYFDDAQRQATRDAGRLAGLEVVRIVNEPTAAALAYGLGLSAQTGDTPRHIAVFDLGGGTFDISILRLTPGGDAAGTDFFQVLSTAGDTHLGGDDIDYALVRLFMEEIGIGGPLPDGRGSLEFQHYSPATKRALVAFARAVKHKLSDETSASVRIDLGGGRVYERSISRDELDSLMSPWIDRAMEACGRAMRDAGRAMGGARLDAVVLVGGSTRVPLVRARVGALFGIEPYTALDPDTVVAQGAAIQAGILAGTAGGALLLDVIPLSLGIETVGGAAAKLVMRNSTVPARATEMFSTSVDGQTSIKLHVVQGEREMVADCRSLGEFHLSGLPAMPAGIPQLEVEFLVDANGVLRVSACERRSGKRVELQIVPNHGLTREEVERIENESFAHAREDMDRHRIVDLVTNAKLDLKWIGERLDRFGGELEPAYRDDLRAQIGAVRGMVEQAEVDWRAVEPDAFHAAKEALAHASVRLQEVSIAASLRED